MTEQEIDAAIGELEVEMEHLHQRHRDLFSFANAWAQRYDALLAEVPGELRAAVEHRLHRVGVRWGMASGVRMTGQFPTIKQPA